MNEKNGIKNSRVDCREVISLCRAECCRSGGGVALTPEEIESGFYEMEYLCIEKKELCQKDDACFHKVVQVKTKDGICGYLGDENRCAIYENRPKICMEYHCTASGWKKDRINFLYREERRLWPELRFEHNASRTLVDVIIPREQGKDDTLYLLIRDTTQCADVMAGGLFEGVLPQENEIRKIYEMFDGETPLGEIEQRVVTEMGADAGESFRKLVVLLAGQKLLIQKMR